MSRDINWEYKSYFPANFVCPPEESYTTTCDIFRFSVDTNLSDNLPYTILKKNFRDRYKNNPLQLCLGSGLSVFLSENAADNRINELINLNKGNNCKFKHLFKVQINHDDGNLLQTGDDVNHYTFWSISGKVDTKRYTYLKSY